MTDGTRTHDNQNHNLGLYQLSYGHHGTALAEPSPRGGLAGLPGGNRTPDPQLRRLLLYPTELPAVSIPPELMVGVERFELPTLCSQSRCATRLRYTPRATQYTLAEATRDVVFGLFLLGLNKDFVCFTKLHKLTNVHVGREI